MQNKNNLNDFQYTKTNDYSEDTADEEFLAKMKEHDIPNYIFDSYPEYLKKASVFVENQFMNSFFKFFQSSRLENEYLKEVKDGDKVLHLGNVAGDFIKNLYNTVGTGSLDIMDVVPLQLDITRDKLTMNDIMPRNVDLLLQDSKNIFHRSYTLVGAYFLLHEVPDYIKKNIIENALMQVEENNAKAIFIDYHHPSFYHPVRPILNLVNAFYEPFSRSLWEREISNYTPKAYKYNWQKKTMFGGVYQKVIVSKKLVN